MTRIPQQIGWSQEAKLLQQILKELVRLQAVVNSGLTHPSITGKDGSTVIIDTNEYTGSWFAIHALEDTVIDTVTDDGSTAYASLTIGSGDTIFGKFTTIQLTSGKVVAYKNPA